jgi:hypothetical protein
VNWGGWVLIVGLVAAAGVTALLLWRPLHGILQDLQIERARRAFRMERERLEAKFLDRAAASGRPRGLRWVDCDWDHDVVFVRHRRSHQLAAFVGVTIRFEAVEGGPMEGVPAVKNLRNATAMFHFDGMRWGTGGKALFNVNPDEAIAHYHEQFEPVPTSTA